MATKTKQETVEVKEPDWEEEAKKLSQENQALRRLAHNQKQALDGLLGQLRGIVTMFDTER